MSRSIHTTHAEISREKRCSYSSGELHRERLLELRRALRKKQRIKLRSRKDRGEARSSDPRPLAPKEVRFEVVDEGPWIHYPASPDDLRAVLGRLPAGVLSGLSCIRLGLGTERQEEGLSAEERRESERDPWFGRVGCEVLPGVYSGSVLGLYSDRSARIELYAYVYDPELPDRARWECYLRLRMLATLLHEVAHLEDHTLRTARGRWRADDAEKAEDQAEARAMRWVRELVVPWLEQAHPAAVQELRQWLVAHGGADLPLDLLAADGHWNAAGRWEREALFGAGNEAFRELARSLHGGGAPTECRLVFANQLHYGELYPEALGVLDRILQDEPGNLAALTLKADIFQHQGEHARAEALARRVIEQDGGCVHAWRILTDVHEARADWERLCDAAGRAASVATEVPDLACFREQRGRALLELGRDEELARELEGMGITGKGASAATVFRALQLLRGGRFQEALDVVQRLGRPFSSHRAVLGAVRFEAAHRLGRPGLAGRLTRRTLEILRLQNHGAWADRLVAEFGRGRIW